MDRFAIRLAAKGHPGEPGFVIFRLTLEIRYNASDKESVRSGPIIVLLPFPYMVKGLTFYGRPEHDNEEYLARVRGSLTAMLRILGLEGQRSSVLKSMEEEIRGSSS